MAAPSRINWRDCAAKLAISMPLGQLHPAVTAWAARCAPAERWVVAFSGGADSLALLLVLWGHWPARRRKLCAVHFNHRLRGAESDADERFCRRVCSALGVQFASARWSAPPERASEAAARAERHAYFTAQLRRWRAKALWFGHQQNDVAETMFMRLARGSGTSGLAAPRPIQAMPQKRVHLRPFLNLAKPVIIENLRAAGAVWREDESNTTSDFFRNRIRRDVLPLWQTAVGNRDAFAGLCLSRELIEEDDTALDAWVEEVGPLAKNGTLNLRRIRGKPRGFVRRALRLWLHQQKKGARLSRQAFSAILNDVTNQRLTRHSLDRLHLVVIGKTSARIVRVPGKISG